MSKLLASQANSVTLRSKSFSRAYNQIKAKRHDLGSHTTVTGKQPNKWIRDVLHDTPVDYLSPAVIYATSLKCWAKPSVLILYKREKCSDI